MKIIEGKFAGTQIKYKEQKGIRVTTDKVRKAVFDVLKNLIHIEGKKVADLFCGSGMYGIESLSRGVSSVWFVDENKNMIINLKKNLEEIKKKFGKEIKYKALNTRFENFVVHYGSTQEHGANDQFDLVFADPPYYDFDFEKLDNIYKILSIEGIFILESSKRAEIDELKNLKLLVEKKYGDTAVYFFRKKQ